MANKACTSRLLKEYKVRTGMQSAVKMRRWSDSCESMQPDWLLAVQLLQQEPVPGIQAHPNPTNLLVRSQNCQVHASTMPSTVLCGDCCAGMALHHRRSQGLAIRGRALPRQTDIPISVSLQGRPTDRIMLPTCFLAVPMDMTAACCVQPPSLMMVTPSGRFHPNTKLWYAVIVCRS